MTSPAGDRLVDAMARVGFEASRAVEAKAPAGSVHSYVELHIEQGPYLERAAIPIGLVKAIVGVRRSRVIFVGRADHAGTMRCRNARMHSWLVLTIHCDRESCLTEKRFSRVS